MLPAEQIKSFIRQTLGCSCPDEVFRSIDVRRHVRLNSFLTLDSAIIIGNRLLVYVADAGSPGCVEEHLPVLVREGMRERDAKGLNRFRLVLVSDVADGIRHAAEGSFDKLRGNDENIHLHMIGRGEIPW